MPKDYFDERLAERYDEGLANQFSPAVVDPVVSFLVDLAGDGGSALELGIGTGRIALPLRQRGFASTGSNCPQPCWLGCAQSRAGTTSP